MGWLRVQGGSAEDDASNTTLAVTINAVGSGNTVCGIFAWASGPTLTSVKDNKNNVYNLEPTVTDTTNSQASAAFSLTNITNNPVTITATISAGAAFKKILVDEFSGGSTASSDERDGAAHGGQFQATPGTGTYGITSGAFPTVMHGDLIWGGCIDAGTTPAIATNAAGFFTGTTNSTSYVGQTTYSTQTTASGNTAVKFTQAAGEQRMTFMIAIKPAYVFKRLLII